MNGLVLRENIFDDIDITPSNTMHYHTYKGEEVKIKTEGGGGVGRWWGGLEEAVEREERLREKIIKKPFICYLAVYSM